MAALAVDDAAVLPEHARDSGDDGHHANGRQRGDHRPAARPLPDLFHRIDRTRANRFARQVTAQIVGKAHQRGLRITPRDLFLHQTVAELAQVLAGKESPPRAK